MKKILGKLNEWVQRTFGPKPVRIEAPVIHKRMTHKHPLHNHHFGTFSPIRRFK